MREFNITLATGYEKYDMAVKCRLVEFLEKIHSAPFGILVRYSDKNMRLWNTDYFVGYLPAKGIGPKRSLEINKAVKQALACVRHDCMK